MTRAVARCRLRGFRRCRVSPQRGQKQTACQIQVADGPDQRMRWGVPDGSRDPQSGELLHDDWVLSAALCAQLEEMDWQPSAPPLIIPAPDPLENLKGKF